jgi:hypothetical protein
MAAQTIVIPAGRGYDVARALRNRAEELARLQQYRAAADLADLALGIDEEA